jgi:two-component system chemotaxis sensor kinase CheA
VTATGDTHFVLNPSDLIQQVFEPGVATAAASRPLDQDWSAMTILVVDDSVTSRILNQKLLGASGFRVITANDGRRALEMLRAQAVQLVLSDVQMPHMDGFDLAKAIKADPALSHIPIVLLTALDNNEDRARGIDAGADAYINKQQLSQSELIHTISQLI